MASAVERTDDLVDKIIDQLQQFIQNYDLTGLKDYWGYLDRRLFSRLEDVYRPTVSKLRTSLYRLYIIHTVQMKNPEKTQEFFQKQALELQGQAEWRDWFALPFVPVPEQNPIFSPYFSRQWADTFLVSLHNFLSVLFQCMPQPVLLSFDAEVQRIMCVQEENEQLRQMLFALQGESRLKKDEEMVHHKLPPYVQHMDRLGDTELDLVSSQRNVNVTTPTRNFFSTFLPQGRRAPAKMPQLPQSSPTQASLGRKDPTGQSVKVKDPPVAKDSKMPAVSMVTAESATGHSRQRRHQDHEKERRELLSRLQTQQSSERKTDGSDPEAPTEAPPDQSESTNQARVCEMGGAGVEQPFIKLSQEEYGEHHSSIMHCRVDCSGRRVASLDIDGVVKVWAFNPIMQTKATIMSKSQLLSLEWAAKPDRLLLLGSGVGTVRLYDTDAKKSLYEMSIDDAHPRILSLACSPSGTSFVCSAAAQAGHSGVMLESDARGSAPLSGQLLLWDTKTVKQQLQFALEPGPVAINCTAFNHNGNLLVTGAADGMIRLFDMQRYESALSWKAHDGEVYSVEFSYDENAVFSIGEDGKFVQWDIHRCGVKQSEYSLSQDAVGPFVLSGYSGYKQVQVPRGRLFAFDSEGQHVLTCSGSGGVIYRLSKAEAGLESVLSLGGHKAPVVTVDWCTAMDCGTCLTASMDGKIKLSTLLAQKP
ncbi:WD repeat-containing protein 91 isoform X2 [Myxocyprinus asiaticus]|uniref:WD repeat-containing protein 91 isoform X2 n=1 Tax=Myxocyprinus asiaticus TaxID=70543 RepID=UPI002222E4CC|nr:WD repeat-containing protein 91 isoform X2 [Myxocyprinus asiaticus]XP_051536888.1 WD repeat-containing protein 91 isoform X2 [Myxocyprinus asiaticus]